MSATRTYLEQAKLDELEQLYRMRGYKVRRGYRAGSGVRYDLVATQGDQRIVFEVKASPTIAGQGKSLRELRRRAYEDGFTDFRLVVVSPPHRTDVSVPGLESELAAYMREHVPDELQGLASNVLIDAVSGLEYSEVRATKVGLEISGDGVVEVTLAYGGTREST